MQTPDGFFLPTSSRETFNLTEPELLLQKLCFAIWSLYFCSPNRYPAPTAFLDTYCQNQKEVVVATDIIPDLIMQPHIRIYPKLATEPTTPTFKRRFDQQTGEFAKHVHLDCKFADDEFHFDNNNRLNTCSLWTLSYIGVGIDDDDPVGIYFYETSLRQSSPENVISAMKHQMLHVYEETYYYHICEYVNKPPNYEPPYYGPNEAWHTEFFKKTITKIGGRPMRNSRPPLKW